MIKVGDKVAYDVAWDVQYGEVLSTKGILYRELLVSLENGGSVIMPESLCMKLTDEEYERLKELSKKGKNV